MSANWKMDAREFGRFVKKGGWYIAYLAARRVKEGNGQGTRTDLGEDSPKSDTCSAREFATEAGLDHKTVLAYLRTWDRAAEQGLVQKRSGFVGKVGVNVPLPDNDAEPWSEWHSAISAVAPHIKGDRRTDIIDAANKAGVGASKALDVAQNPKAVVAAVKADPALAAAIAADDEAALAVYREENKRRTADATPRRKTEAPRDPLTLTEGLILIGANADIRTVLDRVTAAAHEGRGYQPEMRDAMVMAAEEGIALYTSLRGILTGEIDASLSDADIDALLGGQA